jgi:hypothetical protein
VQNDVDFTCSLTENGAKLNVLAKDLSGQAPLH